MSGIRKSYFSSWAAQLNAPSFDIKGTDDFHYLGHKNKILDFSSTSFQASFGLKNNEIISAISQGAQTLPLASPKSSFSLKEDVADQLLRIINVPGKIFWTNSGAESVENALKMARDITGKNIIVSRERSYHGASLGALSVGGDWRTKAVSTVDHWTLRIPEPSQDPDAKQARAIIEQKGHDQIAAICLETITGGNGVIIPDENWYRGIQSICNDYNIMLILDEVICGFGRTGKDFGFQHYPFLSPDFVCLSKALTGGFFPMGATWVKENIANYYDNKTLPCGLTNYAHPIGLKCIEATLDYYNKIKGNLPQQEKIFHQHLNNLTGIKEKRVIGLLAAIEIEKKLDWQYFIDKGLYLFSHNNTLVLAPALNMPTKLIDHGFNILQTSLES